MTIIYVKYGVLNHILVQLNVPTTYVLTYKFKSNRFRFLSIAYVCIISKEKKFNFNSYTIYIAYRYFVSSDE